jgi:hypothetical protein
VRHARIASVSLLLALCAASGPMRKRGSGKVTLAVLPAESDKFPLAAKAITTSLADATIPGVDDKQIAGVSLEVAQLSIECVERTVVCYAKVGDSLSANRLLFAEISAQDRKRVKVTVTLFDVDARKPRSVRRVYANEKEASEKIGDLIGEVAR